MIFAHVDNQRLPWSWIPHLVIHVLFQFKQLRSFWYKNWPLSPCFHRNKNHLDLYCWWRTFLKFQLIKNEKCLRMLFLQVQDKVRGDLVFNATFNNISAISWLSVLLVDRSDKSFGHVMSEQKFFKISANQKQEYTDDGHVSYRVTMKFNEACRFWGTDFFKFQPIRNKNCP